MCLLFFYLFEHFLCIHLRTNVTSLFPNNVCKIRPSVHLRETSIHNDKPIVRFYQNCLKRNIHFLGNSTQMVLDFERTACNNFRCEAKNQSPLFNHMPWKTRHTFRKVCLFFMIVNIETFIQDPIQWYTLISTDRSKAIMNMKFAKRLI